MDQNEIWFNKFRESPEYRELSEHPVVYLSAEYALSDNLPIFAGGLGVLTGDMIRESFDQHFPMIGVGLYYYHGYKNQYEGDVSLEESRVRNFYSLNLKPVLDDSGNRLLINIPIDGRDVAVQAWAYEENSAKVYLLDTNVTSNSLEDRAICDFLYNQEREIRFKQEMVLGIGGFRLFEALNIYPSLYHMNEGHSAFLSIEVIRSMMRAHGVSFEEAVRLGKEKIIFTNHTLIFEGQEYFDMPLATRMLSGYAEDMRSTVKQIFDLGISEKSDLLSMTNLSLRSSGLTNAVSRLHAEKANSIWPGFSMIPITNGVHLPTWDQVQNEFELWSDHQQKKRQLLETVKSETGQIWGENELLIGWARRFVNYKRPMAILENIEVFKKMASDQSRPVRLIYAGHPHPADQEGTKVVNQIKELAQGELKGLIVYLENYNLDVAHQLTAGCDIWLNNPDVGYEACGTSGMKAALNGSLAMSTSDGWMAEIDISKIGWELDTHQVNKSILDNLVEQVIPMYYERTADGLPDAWLDRMKTARSLISENFSSTRMLRDYIEKMYLRILENGNKTNKEEA